MIIKVSFLICSRDKNGIPSISIQKENDVNIIPTFKYEDNKIDIDSFICNKFNFLTGGNANYKNNVGDTNIYICGTIVEQESFSIVFGCYIPKTFDNQKIVWQSMSYIVEEDFFEEKYKDQIISCFNSFSR